MKIRETVSQVMAENEKSFKDIPEARAAKLVQAVLQSIAREVEAAEEGKVTIQGLGVFVVKNVEREKEGVKTTKKRVTFRPRLTGGAGEAGDEGAEESTGEKKGRGQGRAQGRGKGAGRPKGRGGAGRKAADE